MKLLKLMVISIGILIAAEKTSTYSIEGMMCSVSCPKKIDESLKNVNGIKSCKIDFEKKLATVIYEENQIDSKRIASTISNATYYKVKTIDKTKNKSIWNWIFGNN